LNLRLRRASLPSFYNRESCQTEAT
jgi:hypothetical protein